MGAAEHSSGPEFSRWLSGLGEVIETHASWVVLTSDQAFKFKKPVDLGFLDFSTKEKREVFCRQEVELNARLAKDVYRGVVPLYLGPDGYVLGPELDSRDAGEMDLELVDYAVSMRRLDERCRADVLLAEGRLEPGHLQRLAERVAEFHAALPTGGRIAAFGRAEAVRANVQQNFDELLPHALDFLSPAEWQELTSAQLGFLEAHAASFDERSRTGHVKDGHGDLRLEHVYFEQDQIVVVDCIEFSDRFRFADTALDSAFLSMDLRRFGRADLAEDFLARLAFSSGDYEAYALLDFFESYRATVRGKVAAFRERQLAPTSPEAGAAHHEARDYFLQALGSLTRATQPRLICLGGLIASGKSTLARLIGQELHCPIIDADGMRKRLLGLDPWTPLASAPFSGAYSVEASERLYAHLRELARIVLSSGRSVVVDASFRTRAFRRGFADLARECGTALSFVECRAPEALTLERLERRAEGASRSDGSLATFAAFRAAYEAIEPDELPRLLRCDTSLPAPEVEEQVQAFLAGR